MGKIQPGGIEGEGSLGGRIGRRDRAHKGLKG